MTILFAPHLVEAVVRRQVDLGRQPIASLHRERYEALLESGAGSDPESLDTLHAELFHAFGLGRPVEEVAAEFPDCPGEVRVGPADQVEGCFLPDPRSTALLRLHAGRFDRPEPLRRFLRNEWWHLHDMIDPAFGFPRERFELDPAARERYATLWSAFADARSIRTGREPLRSREEWVSLLDRLWSASEEIHRRRALEGFWTVPSLTHAELLGMAADAHLLLQRFCPGIPRHLPGDRCPLCRFPSFHWLFPAGRLSPSLSERIREDFPAWTPDEGACERCVELYEVRTGHW